MRTPPEVDHAANWGGKGSWLAQADSVWVAIAVLLPGIVAMASTIVVIDLGYHLRAGDHILAEGSLRPSEPFSFAEGGPWLNQQWGAQVIFALLFRAGGFPTLSFFRAIAIAGAAAFLYLSCRSRGSDRRTASVLTSLGTLIALPTLGVRPQLLGLVLFTASLWIITTRHAHPGRLWALPVLAVVWVNVHGSFIFLLPLLALAVADPWVRTGSPPRRLIGITTLTVLATLVNPFGLSVWTYVLDLMSNPIVRDWVTEWEPLTIRDGFGIIFFASIGAAVLTFIRRAEYVTWVDLAWLGTFVLVGLSARRSAAFWGFSAPVILAGILPRREGAAATGVPSINAGFLIAMMGAFVLLLPWFRPVKLFAAPTQLVAAVEDATAPGDRIIVHQAYASWFELTLPDRPVLVDSRIELYDASVWHDYQAIREGRADWAEIVDRWQAGAIVTDPTWEATPFLRSHPGWREVFRDSDGVVFVRT